MFLLPKFFDSRSKGMLAPRMTILTEIRKAATDSSHSLSDALRKGLVLASLLRNDELRDWLKKELEGYPDFRNVPMVGRLHSGRRSGRHHYHPNTEARARSAVGC